MLSPASGSATAYSGSAGARAGTLAPPLGARARGLSRPLPSARRDRTSRRALGWMGAAALVVALQIVGNRTAGGAALACALLQFVTLFVAVGTLIRGSAQRLGP